MLMLQNIIIKLLHCDKKNYNMLKQIIYIFIFALIVTSCKSSKMTSNTSSVDMSAKNVIKNHYNNAFDKETVNAKLKIKYIGKSNFPGVTASLRIKKRRNHLDQS